MSKNSMRKTVECYRVANKVQKQEMVAYNKNRKVGVRPAKSR